MLFTVATLFLYRWAIGRAMRAATGEAVALSVAPPASPPGMPLRIAFLSQSTPLEATPANLVASRHGVRRLSVIYALAGLVHAALATLIWLGVNGIEFRPFRALAVWSVYVWPVVAVLLITASATRRQQVMWIAGYAGLLLLLEIIAEASHLRFQPGFGEIFLTWVITMGLPTAVLVLLANRAWRSVGLTALFVSIILMAAFQLGFMFIGCAFFTTGSIALFEARNYMLFAIVLACAALAWRLLRRSARRYQAKQSSDQMFTLDSWWLLVTALEVLLQIAGSGISGLWLLLAFVGYKLALNFGLRRSGLADQPGKPQPMLLLRVFGHAGRTRTLADQVGQTWRHAGPINMIGGTDLATALLEPDELMLFWSGKLRQGFVASPNDLENRLRTLDETRDPDGRYRVNEFFCHDNTWRATVHALAQRSAVVLMDLRGFGKANRGCAFELGLLLDEVPLGRVVLLVDRSTRMEDLAPLLHAAWGRLSAASPNRELAEPVLHLFRVEDSGKALRPLLSRLFAAAA
jgi:hypothetical protein